MTFFHNFTTDNEHTCSELEMEINAKFDSEICSQIHLS
ncbi:unnamed protein product [Schistosoma curassoni]|uniref:Uncharacterized protein n=1 Tax=Schistosoma curassoni TaxID=6186 RepID=A0A183JQT7_9TREM|nr:unnamed protein product [Schistosoma curassoni]